MADSENRIKTDKDSVFGMCNTLNAWLPVMRHRGYFRVAEVLLYAQGLITKLYEENQELKAKKEEIK